MTRTPDPTALNARVTTPFEEAVWLEGAEGRETVSSPFHYEVDLGSEDPALDFTKIVGQSLTLEIDLSGGGVRYINGVVARFSQWGSDVGTTSYRAEVRPWLWLLKKRINSRIFQGMSAPDILSELLVDYPSVPLRVDLTQTYAVREYCVQYQESDFDFFSRLLEQEGIWYYFDHTADQHTCVLLDEAGKHPACKGVDAVRHRGPHNAREDADHLTSCSVDEGVVAGGYAMTDYNFEAPSTSLAANVTGKGGGLEVFEYPGRYRERAIGDTAARNRLDAIEAGARIVTGEGFCRGFVAGFTFSLTEHARADLNSTLLLSEVALRVSPESYWNTFVAVASDVALRPVASTPLPRIYGSQTARVVGKSGEEIWTDSYGRVKLAFHWDRFGKADETSSLWVRVSQAWAGKGFGTVYLPRVGQEVVVTFLDGDPDRPLVIGAVYNADNPVPYALPANQTRSVFKSETSKGGGGFNELCFEDKAGEENVYLHAQKDRTTEILNDENHSVGALRNVNVTGDETHAGEANFTQTLEGNFVLDVKGSITIKAGKGVTIDAGEGIAIKAGTELASSAGTSIKNVAGTEMSNTAKTKLTNDGGLELSNTASVKVSTASDAQIDVKAGAQLSLEGGAMVGVKGGVVKLN